MTDIKRRLFLFSGVSAAALASVPSWAGTVAKGDFEISRSAGEWRALLTDAEYGVMREGDTERPNSSPLNEEKRAGVFHCKGCELPLYDASTKFMSGTGWPSFTAPLPDAIGTMADNGLFSRRTEVHCRRCGSHLGHVFDDGPAPTGKRHCLNGLSLTFTAA